MDITKKPSISLAHDGETSPNKAGEDTLKNSQKSQQKSQPRDHEKHTTIVVNASESPSQRESELAIDDLGTNSKQDNPP
jgi:hypothetical protein